MSHFSLSRFRLLPRKTHYVILIAPQNKSFTAVFKLLQKIRYSQISSRTPQNGLWLVNLIKDLLRPFSFKNFLPKAHSKSRVLTAKHTQGHMNRWFIPNYGYQNNDIFYNHMCTSYTILFHYRGASRCLIIFRSTNGPSKVSGKSLTTHDWIQCGA